MIQEKEMVGQRRDLLPTYSNVVFISSGLAGKDLDISLVPKWMEQRFENSTSEVIEDLCVRV